MTRLIRLLLVWVIVAIAPLAATGQEIGGSPAFNELRRRTPSGASDDEIIDGWIKAELAGLAGGKDPREAGVQFRAKLDLVRTASDTSQFFRDAFHRRLDVLAGKALEEKPAWSVAAAVALTRGLGDANDILVLDALGRAAQHDAPQVRYLAVRALSGLRDKVAGNPAALDGFVKTLRDRGVAESSGVVVEEIYRALSIGGGTDDVIDAIAAILAARVDQYRQGAGFGDSAEVQACQFLQTVNATRDKSVGIVKSLAVLLRLDVGRYAGEESSGDERFAIELRVHTCEMLLEKLTSESGKVRGTMQRGGISAEIQLDIIGWVGAEGDPGLLNKPPWNVAVGAP